MKGVRRTESICEDVVDTARLVHDCQQTPIGLVDTLVYLADEDWNFVLLRSTIAVFVERLMRFILYF